MYTAVIMTIIVVIYQVLLLHILICVRCVSRCKSGRSLGTVGRGGVYDGNGDQGSDIEAREL